MIELGKLTGEYDESGYVGVSLSTGEELFARPMIQAPIVANYTKEWVNSYGDNFLAVIAYENDAEERPILMGIIPLRNPKFPEEGYENNYFFTTPKFRIHVNDDDNKIIIDTLEDQAEILLGNKNVTEQAMLGNKWKNWATRLLTAIEKLTVIAPTGVTSVPVNKAEFTALKTDSELNDILSDTVKLKE